ncbi:hypothetical protein [Scleromatobacter humisilvae]|uniref:Uncharacterized protein n=1 Tax=Scleromatobacter humisilvae TaxID=2897159 RepID=A0A9X1YPX8_9BURK|nr:hypothetical protein [Scleromatobacter humisilvae]MCK9689760.1 hypothetical protein [Scleromatobacter humisilvae]
MTTQPVASRVAFRPTRVSAPRSKALLASGGDDAVLAKLHSVGVQAAMAILLSIFGLGSAMGQSIASDMTLGANTQATRDRVIAEMREAREDGTMKRWSPVLLELPYRAPARRSRFEPIAMRRHQGATTQHLDGTPPSDPSSTAASVAD